MLTNTKKDRLSLKSFASLLQHVALTRLTMTFPPNIYVNYEITDVYARCRSLEEKKLNILKLKTFKVDLYTVSLNCCHKL